MNSGMLGEMPKFHSRDLCLIGDMKIMDVLSKNNERV